MPDTPRTAPNVLHIEASYRLAPDFGETVESVERDLRRMGFTDIQIEEEPSV